MYHIRCSRIGIRVCTSAITCATLDAGSHWSDRQQVLVYILTVASIIGGEILKL